MKETCRQICEWGNRALGPFDCPGRGVARAAQEMGELLYAVGFQELGAQLQMQASVASLGSLERGDGSIGQTASSPEDVAEEMADVVIVLARACDALGRNLGDEVARKMRVNRAREWRRGNDGLGQHVD